MTETRQKILDTAERLFGEFGYSDISLRHIISEAKVNLAAIHYHFGSKQDLLDQVIMRKAGPVNELRIKLLDQFEADAAPGPVSVEKIIEAFLTPVVTIEKSPEFVKLMGRVHSEGLMPEIASRNFQPMIIRFVAALRRALPDLPAKELTWRAHFALGAMAHAMTMRPETDPEAAHEEPSLIIRMLISFVSGGFRAPLAVDKETEVNP